MSMLSIQIGKLRETADEAEKLEFTDRVSISFMHNKLAPMLRDAADTIESLRDRAQTAIELERENERLRRAGYEVGYHDAMAAMGGGECEAIHDMDYYRGINGICEGLYCSKCREPLSSKFRHCPWCGARIKAVKR